MTKAVLNPYLRQYEYVPDGEPRVFGDRIYIYGSHDRAHGTKYCEEDYVGWSAPIHELWNWKYEGILYRKEQDIENINGKEQMFAPDVVQGVDGRYYLYYGLSNVKYIGIAVSENPAGPFEYYGQVKYEDGSGLDGLAFDPGVLVEDNHVYLYYGFAPRKEELNNPKYLSFGKPMEGSYMVRLSTDMRTVISKPVIIANADLTAEGTGFCNHPFLEASSIRKIDNQYYYIYSSIYGHELCYAIGDRPEGPFRFKGVLVSNGDIGIKDEPVAYEANNHGGIANIDDKYYIFYHRHTHGTHYSRQGCAEQIYLNSDGTFNQVEITSCGLNDGPLIANARYGFYIICNLHGPKGACKIPSKPPFDNTVPFLLEEKNDGEGEKYLYLHNMQNSSACGVKYLEFHGETQCQMTLRGGCCSLSIHIDSENGESIGILKKADKTDNWNKYICSIDAVDGIHGVWFVCHANQIETVDLLDFEFLLGEKT